MNKVQIAGAMLAVGLILAGIGCATPKPAAPEAPSRDIPAEVSTEFQRAITSWNVGNLNGFMSIYAEDATFAMRDHFIEGAAAIRDYYAPQFAPGAMRGALSFYEFHVNVLCLDVVLVRAVYQNTQNREVQARGTSSLILRYANGHWRIIHDQST
jgi:uncharacterized protein (TIGR02246 family)